jgi:predicted dithiol-disulfide oxidoreductase (DUF899 family)
LRGDHSALPAARDAIVIVPISPGTAYARGTDQIVNTYALLDLTALGRQEDWEEPKGRVAPIRGGDPTFTS